MKRAAILALAGALTACAAAPAPVAPSSAKAPPPAPPRAALPTPSLAEPPEVATLALPAGWIRGGAPLPIVAEETPGTLSIRQLQINGAVPRPALAPVAIPISALPVAEVVERPSSERPPTSPPGGEIASDLVVTPECRRAFVKGHKYGTMRVEYREQPIAQPEGGGVAMWELRGSRGQPGYLLATWESLELESDGAVHYRETTAWIDKTTCEARVARKVALTPVPLPGGLAFAFLERCPTCAPDAREKLRVVYPDHGGMNWRPIASRSAAIQPGTGQMIKHTIELAAILDFRASGVAVSARVDQAIGIEVVQGTGEIEPTVIAYASDAGPNMRGF